MDTRTTRTREQVARLEAEADHVDALGNPGRAAVLRLEAARIEIRENRQKVPTAA